MQEKPLVWMSGEVRTPPFSAKARIEAGHLLRRTQSGEVLSMPHSRPMPSIGARCHELRIEDAAATWRIIYAIESDAIVIVDVFSKKTNTTPATVVKVSKRRLRFYRSL